ncbi:MAG: hypothetical protein ACRCZM_08900 [Bacteroidales bacterium]
MDVKKIIIFILAISFQSLIAQNELNLGVLYRPRHDATFSRQSGNVELEYSSKRNDIGVISGYKLWKGLNMATSLGVSFYNVETNLYALPELNRSTGQGVSNIDLFISQDIRYDLLRIAKSSDVVNINIGPILNFTYYQNISNRNQFKGFSDLLDQSANDFIDKQKLPVSNAVFRSPSGYLSISGGLYFNLILFKRIGLDYSLGYYSNLFGRTDIDVNYRFESGVIKANEFSTEEKGLIQTFSIRYYFN